MPRKMPIKNVDATLHAERSPEAQSAAALTKVTANLIPRAVAAMNIACKLTSDNRTDVINRSLQVYAYLMKAVDEGKLLFVEDPTTGSRERFLVL
jgi:hypothetical protein